MRDTNYSCYIDKFFFPIIPIVPSLPIIYFIIIIIIVNKFEPWTFMQNYTNSVD